MYVDLDRIILPFGGESRNKSMPDRTNEVNESVGRNFLESPNITNFG